MAWWEEEKRLAESLELFYGTKLAWRQYSDHVPPADELNKMRRRVEGKPDHPDRSLLMEFEKRLSGKTDTYINLWIESPRRWQVTWGRSPEKPSMIKTALGKIAWQAMPNSLTIFDTTRPYPASLESTADPSFLRDAAMFAHQAAAILSFTLADPDSIVIEIKPGRRFTFRSGETRIWQFVAVWPEGEALPSYDAVYIAESRIPNALDYDRAFRFSHEHSLTLGGRRIANRVVSIDRVGYRFSNTKELMSLELLPGDGTIADARLAIPSPESVSAMISTSLAGGDTVRVRDYRNTKPKNLPHGTVVAIPIDKDGRVEYQKVEQPEAEHAKRKFKYIGRIIAGLGLTTIAGVLLWKKRH